MIHGNQWTLAECQQPSYSATPLRRATSCCRPLARGIADMRRIRIYTPQSLNSGEITELKADAAHHLVQVLRLKPGMQLTLFNGDGHEHSARLLEVGKRTARLQLLQRSETEPQPELTIHLGLGLSRGERMDFAIQKSVELGVHTVTPLITEHCGVRISQERMGKRLRHWQAVVVSACEQSGRCRLPRLEDISTLPHWLEAADAGNGVLLDHRSSRCLDQLPRPSARVRLLIGPEGGLSKRERLLAQRSGFTAARLGPRVLRTETAPLAAIASIQMLWGDFAAARQ